MKTKGPDFLSIGPHKTGSTWLYSMLKEHPKIWLPPKKELWILNQTNERYVNRFGNYITRTGMPSENLNAFYRNLPALIPFNSELHWWIKFLVFPYKISQYHHFFPKKTDRLRGDITPNYYFLKQNIIQELATIYPHLKVIITLRNPVDRVWSYSKMHIHDFIKEDISTYDSVRFKNLFDSILSWWIPYYQVIELWQQFFPNVLVVLYDLIKLSPEIYLQKVFDFLGISMISMPNIDINKAINKSIERELPTSLKFYLCEQYQEEIEILKKRFNDRLFEGWLCHT